MFKLIFLDFNNYISYYNSFILNWSFLNTFFSYILPLSFSESNDS